MNFMLTSTEFEDGQPIPRRYTGDGEDLSPPLKWFDPPPGTRSLALIGEAPDSPKGTWIHWVVFNIPAESRELSAGIRQEEIFANGITQGLNSFGKIGYNGPRPLDGETHRYRFRLFALNGLLPLKARASKEQLQEAMQSYLLAVTQLTGTYRRGQTRDLPDDPSRLRLSQALAHRDPG